MWVYTLDGFYSAVAHRADPDKLIVRCRDKGDADRLAAWLLEYGYDPSTEVTHTPTADYAWRLFVSRPAFGHYLSTRVQYIDYPNFKDAVFVKRGAKRAHLYGDVWATMYRLQRGL